MDNFKTKIIIGIASAIFLGALLMIAELAVSRNINKVEAKLKQVTYDLKLNADIQRLLK